jgi:hypothetical protein
VLVVNEAEQPPCTRWMELAQLFILIGECYPDEKDAWISYLMWMLLVTPENDFEKYQKAHPGRYEGMTVLG